MSGRDLTGLYIHPNGSFYAFEWMDKNQRRSRLALSTNFGKTWKYISPEYQTECPFTIYQDPLHPDLVLFEREAGAISYWWTEKYQAEDETYHWKKTGKADIYRGEPLSVGDYPFFGSFRGDIDDAQRIRATLSNFFQLPFLKWGNRLSVDATQTTTAKPSYTFHLHEPVIVPITVEFLQPRMPLRFVDSTDETLFWGIKVLPEGEEGTTVYPKHWYVPEINYSQQEREELLHDPEVTAITIDQDHPYHRKVDLSKFFDFSKPGNYQIQLYHEDLRIVPWGGSFGGQVFNISIAN